MVHDNQFSLGLSYYEIIDLPQADLERFLKLASREEIIDWLQWNDPNGIYNDSDSLREFETIMSKDEGVEIIKSQITNS